VPGAACHGLSFAVTLPVAVTLAISVTFADALCQPVAEPLGDQQQSRGRGNGLTFSVGFPPAVAAGPVLAIRVTVRRP